MTFGVMDGAISSILALPSLNCGTDIRVKIRSIVGMGHNPYV